MINENFINRVIQVLVEMRLDEGIVIARNKALKRKIMARHAPEDDVVQLGRKHYPKGQTPEKVAADNKEYRRLKANQMTMKKKYGPNGTVGTDDSFYKRKEIKPKLP